MGILDTEMAKQPFQQVDSPVDQRTFLDDAIARQSLVTIWTKKKEYSLAGCFLRSYDSALGIELEVPANIEGKTFIENLKSQPRCSCYLNYGTVQAGVFLLTNFVTERVSEKRALVSLDYPNEFFKVQRRTTARLPIRPPVLLLVKIRPEETSHYVQRKVVDISTGGLALLTTPQEAEFFSKGRILKDIKFIVRQKSFSINAEVRHTKIVNQQKLSQLLVGIRFLGMNMKEEVFLEAFVKEEMQSQFAALMKR